MTQEQKQFIIKALESGIPAIAREHIEALEEVAKIAEAKQEELEGAESFQLLDQRRHENIIRAIQGSYPYMANDIILPYDAAIRSCQAKFAENIKAREAKEKAEKEAEGKEEEKKSA